MIFLKPIYIVILVGLAYLYIGNINKKEIVIPDNSMRFRIVANSDSKYDQNIKLKVKSNLENSLGQILQDTESVSETEQILENNIEYLNNVVEETLVKEKYIKGFKVELGYNYFPEKEYYGVKYREGNYKSLVVTLGDGAGKNWWCVLFPPLCLIEAEEQTEYEYQFFVKEMIKKYF